MQSNNVASMSSVFDIMYPLNIIVSRIIMYPFELHGMYQLLYCYDNDQPKKDHHIHFIIQIGCKSPLLYNKIATDYICISLIL